MSDEIVLTPEASTSKSPTNANEIDGKKRSRESNASESLKSAKKTKAESVNGEIVATETKGVFCHQCRRRTERFLSCTGETCKKSYCENDLRRRYDTALSDFVDSSTECVVGQQIYTWTCPHCRGICQTDVCRRKAGLEPLGRLNGDKKPKTAGTNGVKGEDTIVASDGGKPAKVKAKKATIKDSEDNSTEKPKKSRSSVATSALAKSPKTEGSKPKTKSKSKPKSQAGIEIPVIGSSSLSPPPTLPSGPKPHDPKKKRRPSHVFSFGSDSSLTDDEDTGGPSVKPKKAVKANGLTKKTTKKADGTAKTAGKVSNAIKGKGKEKAGGKEENAKGKGKDKEKGKGKDVEKKVRAKPVKKAEVPVDPPMFEKVDTRLGRVEAEHRIMLREYLCRFRAVLSIPERSLPALDDFDRPPTDASVRLFAGAMLDLIKEDLVEGNADEDIIETVEKYREELRYYADLARFANAYKQLEEPLDLELPKIFLPATSGAANATAVRTLLGLVADEALPAWADGAPARRTAVTRLPSHHEVIRMLLAFAERTLSTPAIRADLVWEAPENEARRVHARELKKENEEWAKVKKNLMAAALHCKTAAATKLNKEKTAQKTKEHDMRLAIANVNLRSALSSRAARHEALGTDLDGRIYYCLSQRPIDDDSRPPIGWGSGLLVWGIGVPGKADVPIDEDDLPLMVERWCHFGQSTDVRQLVKWIEYRTRKAVEGTKKIKTPAKSKMGTPNGKATPNGKSAVGTPSKQLALNFGLASSSSVKPSAVKRKTLEVVMPVTKASRASTESDEQGSTSELSDLSSDDEELLSHLAPEGYKPSMELVEENGKELARKLADVAEWLEVLESKGMGEVIR